MRFAAPAGRDVCFGFGGIEKKTRKIARFGVA
jgi:hypothetical protein